MGHYEGQNTFSSRNDAFIRKGGLMPETPLAEVPWDIQMKGRSSGLHKRLQSQGGQALAGKMFTPAPAPNSVQYAMGVQAFQLGMDPWSRTVWCRPRKWKQKVQDASSAARTTRLTGWQWAAGWQLTGGCCIPPDCRSTRHTRRAGGVLGEAGASLWCQNQL